MNNRTLFGILTFLTALQAHAQPGWSVQRAPVPGFDLNTAQDLNSIYFINAKAGWTAGAEGIWKTADSGNSWIRQVPGTNAALNAVFFADTLTGWAAGAAGTLIATTNGGATWISTATGTAQELLDVDFVTVALGYVVGGGGTILKTTNAGSTWQTQNSGVSSSLRGVQFPTPETGWIAGDSGRILKTTNGGESWSMQYAGDANPGFIVDLFFRDTLTGWALRSGALPASTKPNDLLHTTDGGVTWVSHGVNSGEFHGLYFSDANTGFIVGTRVHMTVNGGATLTSPATDLSTVTGGKSVFFTTPTTGWIVTKKAGILKTVDGGYNWERLYLNGTDLRPGHLYSVKFADSLNGWAVGSLKNSILKTTDGGVTWVSRPSGATKPLREIDFIDNRTGWAVGDSGCIVKTTDGGQTWIRQASGTTSSLLTVDFLDANLGWVGGANISATTRDGGGTWNTTVLASQFSIPSLRQLDSTRQWSLFFSAVHTIPGYILPSYVELSGPGGTGHIGGESLALDVTKQIKQIMPANKDTAYVAANGKILKSTNGGAAWVDQPASSTLQFNSVHVTDANTGWAVGAGGTIVRTIDGGLSGWRSENSGTTRDLNSVFFTDPNRGWAVGNEGIILRYTGPTPLGPSALTSRPIGAAPPSFSREIVALRIRLARPAHRLSVRLVDMRGKEVFTWTGRNLGQGEHSIPLPRTTGISVLEWTSDGARGAEKLPPR